MKQLIVGIVIGLFIGGACGLFCGRNLVQSDQYSISMTSDSLCVKLNHVTGQAWYLKGGGWILISN